MKTESKVCRTIEAIGDKVFSDSFQTKAIAWTFGTLEVFALIGSFWNPWQLVTAGICAIMVLCGIVEYKKEKKQ